MLSTINSRMFPIFYEALLTLLAILVSVLTFLDLADRLSLQDSPFYYIDITILIIFAVDYFSRLIASKSKKEFIKNNIPDLIAIIPFNSLFRLFRILRLLRLLRFARLIKIVSLLRFTVYIKKFTAKLELFLHTNGFINMLYFTISIIILGAGGIYLAEKGTTVQAFDDAVWWSFVTTSTVGYGDISPSTTAGRIIAAVLMISGIGFISMLTGTIANYFFNLNKKKTEDPTNDLNTSDLTATELQDVIKYIEFLKSKR